MYVGVSSAGPVRTEEIAPGVLVAYCAFGGVVGVEIVGATRLEVDGKSLVTDVDTPHIGG